MSWLTWGKLQVYLKFVFIVEVQIVKGHLDHGERYPVEVLLKGSLE